MRITIPQLHGALEVLIAQAGFPPELYIIKKHEDSVSIEFDVREAVDYFKGDFDASDLARDCIFEYKRVGKRHAAFIYPW